MPAIVFSWIPGFLIHELRDSAEWIRSINCDQGLRPPESGIVKTLMSVSPGAKFPAFNFSSTVFSIVGLSSDSESVASKLPLEARSLESGASCWGSPLSEGDPGASP